MQIPCQLGSTVVENETLYLSRGWSVSGWWWWGREVWRTGLSLRPRPFCRGSACPHRGRNPTGIRRRRSTAPSVSVCLSALRGRPRPRGGRGWRPTAWCTQTLRQMSTDSILKPVQPFGFSPASTASRAKFLPLNLSYHADWTDVISALPRTRPDDVYELILRLGVVFTVNFPPCFALEHRQ